MQRRTEPPKGNQPPAVGASRESVSGQIATAPVEIGTAMDEQGDRPTTSVRSVAHSRRS